MTEHIHTIRHKAIQHHAKAVKKFHGTHKHARRLLKKHKVVVHRVRQHSLRTAAVASISTGLLAVPAALAGPTPNVQADLSRGETAPTPGMGLGQVANPFANVSPVGPSLADANKQAMFQDRIFRVAPPGSSHLSAEEEIAVTRVIQETFGIAARAELEGIRLNVVRGIMAGEQHLPLYPGDKLENHFKNRFTGEVADPTAHLTGMVPGLPSWGYFAKDATSVTKKDVEREQFYVAAQTFLAPGWQQRTNHMYQWFKYRKVIVINQKTGQAVVACIADAGPSPYTGRSFGGSNEVMISVGLGRIRTGEVMVLFVDDPEDKIPLGPLTGYPL
jgi:hypothetical protein